MLQNESSLDIRSVDTAEMGPFRILTKFDKNLANGILGELPPAAISTDMGMERPCVPWTPVVTGYAAWKAREKQRREVKARRAGKSPKKKRKRRKSSRTESKEERYSPQQQGVGLEQKALSVVGPPSRQSRGLGGFGSFREARSLKNYGGVATVGGERKDGAKKAMEKEGFIDEVVDDLEGVGSLNEKKKRKGKRRGAVALNSREERANAGLYDVKQR